ncbi:uncharacterized protein TNCV_3044331 [Trichonephila clavipes]|nr:uncharacterized protein TNCV_3044331 [Trichonephila clavipes]
MELHKICGNHSELSQCLNEIYDFSRPNETKTLGVSWDLCCLGYKKNRWTLKHLCRIELPRFKICSHGNGDVPSNQNPADLISRGVDPDKLLNQELWWNGSEFLSGSDYLIKIVKISENNDAYNSELKSSVREKLGKEVPALNICVDDFVNNLRNISNNYLTILRILSYILGVQSREFSVDIKCLQQQQRVLPKSKLKSLNPFLDSDGVLRVGGRLGDDNKIRVDKVKTQFSTYKRAPSKVRVLPIPSD